ncbi:hypothetical protein CAUPRSCDRAFT_12983 [Caulochytrium protostelioides]|nr:hypothetical protein CAUPRSCDRAFT_12983 [Caulochytrium protostelioides]
MRPEEEAIRTKLENMLQSLRRPVPMKGQIQEFQARIQMLKDARRLAADPAGANPRGDVAGADETLVVLADEDQTGLAMVHEALEGQQRGLQLLSDLVNNDQKDVATMSRGYKEVL